MYRVIREFKDLQDKGHHYKVGDRFPHHGLKVSEERLMELSGYDNRRHLPLIKEEHTEKAFPLTEETHEELKTGETTVEPKKAKRKAKKSHVGADS